MAYWWFLLEEEGPEKQDAGAFVWVYPPLGRNRGRDVKRIFLENNKTCFNLALQSV